MAIKKSDLYSSLWASCDELRGGMDASQYKDYVLFMLFIKYISDKYGNSKDFAPQVTIPKGASFSDMVALKGDSDIGNKINVQVIQPLIDHNARLARTDFPDFNEVSAYALRYVGMYRQAVPPTALAHNLERIITTILMKIFNCECGDLRAA